MLTFWHITSRSLRHHPIRSATTMVAIAIATSALLSVQMLLGALDQQTQVVSDLRAGSSDLDVRTVLGLGLNAQNVQQISSLPGVANAAPLYQKRIAVYRQPGDPGEQATLEALNGPGQVALRSLPLNSGAWPHQDDQIALDSNLRNSFGGKALSLGDHLSLTTALGPQTFTVVGFSGASTSTPSFLQNSIFVTSRAAIGEFGLGLHTPLLALHLLANASKSSVATQIGQLYTGQVSIVDPRSDLQQPLFQVRGLLGLIALLTATLAIVSTTSGVNISVFERRREVGLLRIAGAQSWHLYGLFLLEGACLALVGCVLGVAAGFALGGALIWSQGLGTQVTSTVSSASVLLSLFSGFGAGLLGAAIAARPVVKIPILEALRPSSPTRREPFQLGVVFIALIGSYLGGILLTVHLQEPQVAVFLAIAGIAYVASLAVPGIAWLLATAASGLRQESFLWFSRLFRNYRRSALAVAGLSSSVAIVVAIAIATAGTLDSSNLWISKLFIGDVVITSPVTQPDVLVAAVKTDTGAADVVAVRQFAEPVSGFTMGIAATDTSVYNRHQNNLVFSQGDRASAFRLMKDGGAAVLVPASIANSSGWQLGQTLLLGSPPNQWTATIAGILQHSFPAPDGSETILLDKLAAINHFGAVGAGFDFLQVAAGSSTVSVIRSDALRYGMQATTVADLQARAQAALLRDLGLLLALGALAVALAGVAIVNTITINISAMTKELTLLRAIGMQQRQARALLVGQASILVLTTLVVGVVGGMALFVPVAQSASTPTLVPVFAFPYQLLLPAGVLVVAATLTTVWLQAYRVTKSDVIHAMQHE